MGLATRTVFGISVFPAVADLVTILSRVVSAAASTLQCDSGYVSCPRMTAFVYNIRSVNVLRPDATMLSTHSIILDFNCVHAMFLGTSVPIMTPKYRIICPGRSILIGIGLGSDHEGG